MNALQMLARQIIKISFNFSVWFIEQFHNMKPYDQEIEKLRELPENSLGNDIAKCLDNHKLRLVPNFESHDLKHVLLHYGMTPVDEIRMQAFMLGNGNYTLPCFAILLFGAVLLPEKWKTFYNDFKRGKNTWPISAWTIENFAELNTKELQEQIKVSPRESKAKVSIESITKFGAFAAIITGIFGMLFCLPFLFSSSIADLIGAGFPFVGGAILSIGGLLALSNLSKPRNILEPAANTR